MWKNWEFDWMHCCAHDLLRHRRSEQCMSKCTIVGWRGCQTRNGVYILSNLFLRYRFKQVTAICFWSYLPKDPWTKFPLCIIFITVLYSCQFSFLIFPFSPTISSWFLLSHVHMYLWVFTGVNHWCNDLLAIKVLRVVPKSWNIFLTS